MQDMLEVPAIKDSWNIDHIKRHYYYSHEQINPYRIIPKGPNTL
jgi:putative glutathione S-transferase